MNIKNKAIGLLERRLTKTAIVLATRAWTAGTFYEVDLHIPDADFDNRGLQHIKCRVGQLVYREYTISLWDNDTKTCTLFIDAAHDGQGSTWVKALEKNDSLAYLHVETHPCTILPDSKMLFLGDQSTIGHFLAIQQLAGKDAHIEGAILMPHTAHRSELAAYYPGLNVQPLDMVEGSSYLLSRWVEQRGTGDDMVYLAGNVHLVVALRQQLRVMGYSSKQIYAQGFWK